MRNRYSIIMLVALSCLSSFIAVQVSLVAVSNSNHKWCQVVNTITSIPVPIPENPKADPRSERSYKFYTEFVQLQRDLGC